MHEDWKTLYKYITTVQCDCWDVGSHHNRSDCDKCGGDGTYARKAVQQHVIVDGREVVVMRYVD